MRAKDKELHTIIFACSHLHIFKRLISVRVTYSDHDYEVLGKDFQAFLIDLVKRLTSAEFAFLIMVSNPYVL